MESFAIAVEYITFRIVIYVTLWLAATNRLWRTTVLRLTIPIIEHI